MVLIIYLAFFMLLIGSAFLCLFLFALKKGQFDDMQTPAHKMLLDDEEEEKHG